MLVTVTQQLLNRYSPAIHYAASCKLAEVLSLEHFNETVAAKLPWILEKVMMNPLCKDSAVYQQRLADILLDLRKFMVFYEHDTLKYDLIKYPLILLYLQYHDFDREDIGINLWN